MSSLMGFSLDPAKLKEGEHLIREGKVIFGGSVPTALLNVIIEAGIVNEHCLELGQVLFHGDGGMSVVKKYETIRLTPDHLGMTTDGSMPSTGIMQATISSPGFYTDTIEYYEIDVSDTSPHLKGATLRLP